MTQSEINGMPEEITVDTLREVWQQLKANSEVPTGFVINESEAEEALRLGIIERTDLPKIHRFLGVVPVFVVPDKDLP